MRRLLPPHLFVLILLAMLGLHLGWPGMGALPVWARWLGLLPAALGHVAYCDQTRRWF